MSVQIEFSLSFEELNDLRTAIIDSHLSQSAKEWYVAKISEVQRKEIISSSRTSIRKLVEELSVLATDKDNLVVVDAIEANIDRLKSVLK
jgi:gamma-glutamyl-gamma-aminobutyrate hydrolase PuuD